MRKVTNTIIILAALTALFLVAIYLDVPNYITYYNRPNDETTISTQEDKDFSKCTGLVEYILDKNKNNWESLVPDAFYLGLNGEKVIRITVNRINSKPVVYEYNSFMGVLKLDKKCLYLSNGDKIILNLLF